MNQGLVHIYCGDGKGKTTAALGLGLRASGHGLKVLLVQFLKSGDTGELTAVEKLDGFRIIRGKGGRHFSPAMSEEEINETIRLHNINLELAIAEAGKGACDLLILDEVIGAVNKEMLNRERLIEFIKAKPSGLEVVLTGRNPDQELLALADYVSEIRKVRHPLDRGIGARKGIEK